MKDRVIQCEFYICEKQCSKGRDGIFKKTCQTCNLYKAKRGAAPYRVDTRREKLEKIKKREGWY